MKLKYIIPFFMAVSAMLFSCSDDDSITLLDAVQVSSSYISIPLEGGSNSFTVNAKSDWTLEKVTTKKDSVKWLTVSAISGASGETTVNLSASSTLDGRSAELLLKCGGKTQHINVIQGLSTVSQATCAEVIAGPDSKTYRVKGTCTAIANTTYGNWYLSDGTGNVYIYGTLDAKGAEKNFSSLGIEVGDIVTVEGPKSTYGSTVELVNVTVVKIEKSLIKVDSTEIAGVKTSTLPLEGGTINAHVTCKGQGVTVDIPDDAKDWLSISSIKSSSTGAVVTFNAAANTGGDRKATITFHTTDGSKDYTSQTTISQKGAIITCSAADFNAAAVGDTQYRITGIISKVASDKYGNFYIKDASGEIYVYGLKDFSTQGLNVGDIVTVVGKRGEYKTTKEMVSPVFESVKNVETVSIADFRAKADDKTTYYLISGTVGKSTEAGTKYDLDTYGNFALTDATGSVYIYGVTTGWNGESKKFGTLGVKEGDNITIIAYKTSYKGTIEGVGIFLSKASE
jgi:RPA family protein